jgi:hypothetical protein
MVESFLCLVSDSGYCVVCSGRVRRLPAFRSYYATYLSDDAGGRWMDYHEIQRQVAVDFSSPRFGSARLFLLGWPPLGVGWTSLDETERTKFGAANRCPLRGQRSLTSDGR